MDKNNPHDLHRAVFKTFREELAKFRWTAMYANESRDHLGFFSDFDFVINVHVKDQYIDFSDEGDPDVCLLLTDEEFADVMQILQPEENAEQLVRMEK